MAEAHVEHIKNCGEIGPSAINAWLSVCLKH